jgi:hypothetical protein
MYSAYGSIRAVAIFTMLGLSGTVALPQSVKFIRHAADPLPNISSSRATCTMDSGSAVVGAYTAASTTNDADAPCDTPSVTVPRVNPCVSVARLGQIGCDAPKDRVLDDLAALGKTGQKILRARDQVLEILGTENACTAWYREKDANPAETFRTLSYEVDRRGEEVVHVSKDAESQYIFRDPDVARVSQDAGAFTTITLNAGGAFFHALTTTIVQPREGGLWALGRARTINVGPYPGDSLAAQILALLHEFGHVIDLLPLDFNNEDGKSVRNTAKVLRFCQAEIDSRVKRSTVQAAR